MSSDTKLATMRSYAHSSARPSRALPATAYTHTHSHGLASPTKKEQKHVVFQLIDMTDPRIQARLPMRVMISQHDTTDSIITTVKNFYGLYDQDGVSFENKEGISIIAAYDNFENDMVVYVRTVPQSLSSYRDHPHDSASPKKPTLGAPIELRPTNANFSPSRSAQRSADLRSMSPQADRDRRSASSVPGAKPRPLRTKSKDQTMMVDADGYSSGENDDGSVTSSRRSRTEQVNAEISVDNIVEGGRRKRAFESSELPLFVPPQVPMSASISSVSPQRRSGPGLAASPYAPSNQHTFSYSHPLPSPQSFGSGPHGIYSNLAGSGVANAYQQTAAPLRGARNSINYNPRFSSGGILPTPDPTINSVISDEDVALQLMRLGDPAAFSHGRTSTSTVDDAFSGKAEAASSEEDEEDDDDDDDDDDSQHAEQNGAVHNGVGPHRKKPRLMNDRASNGASGDDYEDYRNGTFASSDRQLESGKNSKTKSAKQSAQERPPNHIKPKAKTPSHQQPAPMSPSSLPAHSRKPSISSTINFQHQLADDEEDLSSKPRCQRCRKSKKGCDRQRPCGRCKDAGIGIDGCVSEDEGNGRKGRYGRHMGVPVKKLDDMPDAVGPVLQPTTVHSGGFFLAPAIPDKNKKRKR